MGSRIKDIGSKDLKGMLDLAWCRGALGLSISEIILVSLESKLGFKMYGKSRKKPSKSQFWRGLRELLGAGCSWVLRVAPWRYFGGF